MRETLIQSFASHTYEEKILLRGGSLQQEAYTNHQVFLVESAFFLPPKQLIGLRPHTRFTTFPTHWHDYMEMMVVLKGKVCHGLLGGERVSVKAGEVLLINRHSAHHIEPCGEEDIALNLIIKPSFLSFVTELKERDQVLIPFLLDSLRSEQKGPSFLHFSLAPYPSIQSFLDAFLLSLCTPEKKAYSLGLYQGAMALLVQLLLSHPQAMHMPTSAYQENPLLLTLFQEMNANYSTFVLQDFAKKHKVSPAYLCRLIKKVTGTTCSKLLHKLRVQKAKELLTQTDLSILEICSAVGYSNSSYFYRLFFDHCGLSPNQWRSQIKKSNLSI